ncbi:bifunctional helix-turn-helix transcriptional regulator/GNAT family N-acetyltransferase [Duffyella gerundensis]|uniref:bifunctional helix-turn-helix transcriptional regulator/GNAT family N-acetyltransferase n=1 Tax=Duffyella gerundensis TaxID=1619313 RepID=UPI003FCF0142
MSTGTVLVRNIRAASRVIVRELGFIDLTFSTIRYSPSAIHTLIEIEKTGGMTLEELQQFLGIEGSSVLRTVNRLLKAGEIEKWPSVSDGRKKQLRLSKKGSETVNTIHIYGDNLVRNALEKLDPISHKIVKEGLHYYAFALKARRTGHKSCSQNNIRIATGYHTGMVGRITEMHISFYAREHGFGSFFEAKVAAGLADFTGRLHKTCNQVWLAMMDNRIVGSIAIDGEDLGNNEAHLRWFILDDGCRGSGTGKALIREAMKFCEEQGFDAIRLWTFNKLSAAIRLYESFGFELAEEWEGDQWGSVITEQLYIRRNSCAV